MHVSDIIHPCDYESVPEHLFGLPGKAHIPYTKYLTYFYVSSYFTVFHLKSFTLTVNLRS